MWFDTGYSHTQEQYMCSHTSISYPFARFRLNGKCANIIAKPHRIFDFPVYYRICYPMWPSPPTTRNTHPPIPSVHRRLIWHLSVTHPSSQLKHGRFRKPSATSSRWKQCQSQISIYIDWLCNGNIDWLPHTEWELYRFHIYICDIGSATYRNIRARSENDPVRLINKFSLEIISLCKSVVVNQRVGWTENSPTAISLE